MDVEHLGEATVAFPLKGVDGMSLDGALEVAHEGLNPGEESRERVDDDGSELSGVHVDAAVLQKVNGQPLYPSTLLSAMLTQKPSGART